MWNNNRSWNTIQNTCILLMQCAGLVLSLLSLLMLLFIPESPRWLFSRGKNEKARKVQNCFQFIRHYFTWLISLSQFYISHRKITERMAKFNKVHLTEDMWNEAESIGNKKSVFHNNYLHSKLRKTKLVYRLTFQKNTDVEKRYTTVDLFRRRITRCLTFKIMFSW